MSEHVSEKNQIVKFPFLDDMLDVVPGDTDVSVVVRPVCEALGVSPQGQLAKLASDPSICLKMILTQIPGDDQRREVACVGLDSYLLWLAGIHPKKVKPEVREKLIAYKRRCASALRDHFLGRREPSAVPVELLAMIADMRAELADLRLKLGARPAIGTGAARLYVLAPLREVALLQARALRNESAKTVASLRLVADRTLRERVGYPMGARQRWESFPSADLGRLCNEVARLRGEAERFARAANPARQIALKIVK